jgi:hypothetical protein
MSFQKGSIAWEPPDGLGFSSLRPVRLSRQGMAMAVMGAVFLAGSPVLGLFLEAKAVRERDERQLLHDEGRAATARIMRLWRDGKDSSEHMVGYRFPAETGDVEGRARVPAKIWKELQAGGTLAVRYVPSQPKINHPADWPMNVIPRWLGLLLTPLFWIAPTIFALVIRRQMRLLTEGRPAQGIVTSVKRTDKAMQISYEFRLLSGATAKGKSTAGRRPPAVGSAVCVLYDPENPRRNALYPLQLVRLQRS